jgi:hypothetical protein
MNEIHKLFHINLFSSVGIVTMTEAVQWQGHAALLRKVQTGSDTHTASYSMGKRGAFPGVKGAASEFDHSHPSSTEVKNEWSYKSTTPPPPPSTHSWRTQGQIYLQYITYI